MTTKKDATLTLAELRDAIAETQKKVDKYKRKYEKELKRQERCKRRIIERGMEPKISSKPSSVASKASGGGEEDWKLKAERLAKMKSETEKKEVSGESQLTKKGEESKTKTNNQIIATETPSSAKNVTEEKGNRDKEEGTSPKNPVPRRPGVNPPTEKKTEDKSNKEKKSFNVRAIQAFKATNKTELSFAKGTVIVVDDQNKEQGTYHGSLQGKKKSGWFPSYYVVEC
jgi:hypothetical protein